MAPTLIHEYDPSLGIAHLTLGFDMGSLVDPAGKEGATSLLFRLMRRCAPKLTPPQVEQRLDALGCSAGADVARSVSALEGTCLVRSFAPFMDLLVSMLGQAPFAHEELDRLKAEAIAEWTDSLDNDSLIARRYFARKVFPDHPYARLTSGTPSSIASIELQDLTAAYHEVVSRRRLICCFSGDLERTLAERAVESLAEQLQEGSNSSEFEPEDPQVRPGRHLYFVDKPERNQVQILIGTSGVHPLDPDRTAVYVGNTIFGGTFGARLSREVRGKRGWSYGAYSQLAHDRKRQSFSMWTFPQATDAGACISLEIELLTALVDRGITKRELAAAKKYLLNSHAFALDTASKRASLAFDQKIYQLPPLETFRQRISEVTVDQVNEALKARISPKDLTVVVLGTKSDLLTQVQDAIPDLNETEVIAFDSRE